MLCVLREGAGIVLPGVIVGAASGYALAGVASSYVGGLALPGPLPLLAAAGVLVTAAVVASLMPAARAAHVDVVQALRSE